MNAIPMPTPDQEVLFRVVNRCAVVTLNRPQALNALTHSMVRELAVILERVRADDHILALVLEGQGPKGFCAGGDVRTLYQQAKARERQGSNGWQQFFVDEYNLDYALHTFEKPIVALMDGVTMGGGMGLAQAADLRVATPRTKIAMPETRIGLLPDVGATSFMSRMDPALELYVGLTGAQLSGADAVYCHLADVCVEAQSLEGYEDRLREVEWVESDTVASVLAVLRKVFAGHDQGTANSVLPSFLPLINRYFDSGRTVKQMASDLQGDLLADDLDKQHTEAERKWLEAALDALTQCSPLMLEVTREALISGREMTLAQCFRMELGVVRRALEEGDFCEGVRALLIDKDRNPHWKLHALMEVWPQHIQHYLSCPWGTDSHPLVALGR
ncbi:enoyl-CoA hydratase/isomerase family protein [Paraburkholderia sp. CNPSo 3281]|uniref:enoyl-CoA hydratase/isomerase family protein n=1 Tax=Paraburkholderia sp. CNPSo 3281 TaxID=2940933 RepID=UPI0020B6B92A|nr:enoyl-CoA hydratase/isomerase family protein [Paraburkholderia sp. CNPSo 3281]MCP3721087.1 enoyl-CoA hydratase/isomerase family protein [Paraburkholderia sp. CNPSo 3281]